MRNLTHLSMIALTALPLTAGNAQERVRPGLAEIGFSGQTNAALALGIGEEPREPKSAALAIAYSLLLPGLGDLYAENFSTGRYFMVAEGGLWLSYAGFQAHGHWLRQDARSFAVQHAGADFGGQDDRYAVDVGNFSSIVEYNETRLREREYDRLYDVNASLAWLWDSDENRRRYKDLRIRSDEVIRNSKFLLGAMVVNRIIAAISAARAVGAYDAQNSKGAWRVGAAVSGGFVNAHGLEVRITRVF